jgi:hypothetical protein
MPSCRLIVCEKTSHWAAALRAESVTQRPRVVETRSLAGCEAALAESMASLVAIEITSSNVEAALVFIVRTLERYPQSSVVVLLAEDAMLVDGLMREAGAIDSVNSVIEAPRVARLARRQFAQAPQEQIDVQEFLAERMPWPAHATA